MIIEHLKWQEVVIKHLTNKKEFKNKIETLGFAYITLENDRLSIQEWHPMSGIEKSYLFANPMLVKLTAWEVEIDAEWWRSVFSKDGSIKRDKNHKVKITAKF